MQGTKFLATFLLLTVTAGLFTGCFDNRYNAVLYDNAAEWINEDFINANSVWGKTILKRAHLL